MQLSALRIVYYPDPILRRVCEPVEMPDPGIAALARRMFELMYAARGVGLAAPQVGIPIRLFVCNPTGQPEDERVFVNPHLSDLVGQVEAVEGCLSIPEVSVPVVRARRCRIDALDAQGNPVRETVEDLLARIVQHEYDHLEGRLILDYQTPAVELANRKYLRDLEVQYRRRAASRDRRRAPAKRGARSRRSSRL